MRWRGLLCLLILIAGNWEAPGQQLLLMKKGSVSTRFDVGDDIYFELKDQKQIHHATIKNIREFYFTTAGGDTIQYTRVALIIFRNDARKKYGMTMAITGAALLAVYGINALAFDENSQSMRGLRLVGVLGTGFGMLVYLTADKKVRLKGGKRLKYVPYDSPLYR